MIDTLDRHPRPLGDAQHARRSAEQTLRRMAVEMVHAGQPQSSVADVLQLAPQTLSSWMRRTGEAVARGRPPAPVDPVARSSVVELLESHGRSIGVPTLKQLFSGVPRSVLQDIREQWCSRQQVEPALLGWTTPGSVWSADFTQTPLPIDGVFNYVLVVRDLASQFTLLAAPCSSQCADTVVFSLHCLFNQHSPPLVLKTDNGSPFIADVTLGLCRVNRVVNLLSPPLTPQYNGSIEATGGQLKARAALIAQQQACDTWTGDILEAARLAANALNRPWGPSAPTPEQRWIQRQPIAIDQRASLATLIAQKSMDIAESIQRERREKGLAVELTAACRANVARTATRQALVELGYLQIRRPTNTSTQNNADFSRN